MGWLERLYGNVVAIDTAPLIYFFEDHEQYAPILAAFFRDLDAGKFRAVTSVVSLIEVLVHPLRHGDEKLASQYNDALLSHAHLKTLPVSLPIGQLAAELRAEQNLKTPDAIQLATAMKSGAVALLTNDRDFGTSSGLEFLRISSLG